METKCRIPLLAVLLVAALALACAGLCPAAEDNDARAAVLEEFYPPGLAGQMRKDAAPIIEKFNNINIFSTCQFGTAFLEGVADVGDVFDARVPRNMEIFTRWARERLLMLNKPEREGYARYALAGAAFLRALGYDCVLFRPDEEHPVFTSQRDTWMFLREEPVKAAGEGRYYSGRVKARRVTVEGGMAMEALDRADCPWLYVPVAGTRYVPWRAVAGEIVEATTRPELVNPFAPACVTVEMKELRRRLGIAPSALSGRRSVPVGAWVKPGALEEKWKIGFRFSGSERAYTWSACGVYVLPLDRDFWN